MTDKKLKEEKTTPTPTEQIPDWAAKLQESINAQAEQIATLTEENTMLKEMAGKNAIASFEEGKKDHRVKRVYLKRINDKIVVGWGELDTSKMNPNAKNADQENIKMHVKYLGEEKTEEIPYMSFIRCSDYAYAELIKYDSEGKSRIKLVDSGEEITVESKFLNA